MIVRRLEAIENFGSMTCSALTRLERSTGDDRPRGCHRSGGAIVRRCEAFAFLNAALETGIDNPIDAAIVAAGSSAELDTGGITKVDEIPYDFLRRRLTIVLEEAGERLLVTKGAFADVAAICASVAEGTGAATLTAAKREQLERFFGAKGQGGLSRAGARHKLSRRRRTTHSRDEAEWCSPASCSSSTPKGDAAQALRNLAAASS